MIRDMMSNCPTCSTPMSQIGWQGMTDPGRRVVHEEIRQYRENQLPDEIRRIDAEVKKNKADADKRLAALERERKEFQRIVAGHLELLSAVESWIEWCEGRGETERQPQLWARVKTAWKKYCSLRVSA